MLLYPFVRLCGSKEHDKNKALSINARLCRDTSFYIWYCVGKMFSDDYKNSYRPNLNIHRITVFFVLATLNLIRFEEVGRDEKL